MIVCHRCGKENQNHYKFCLGCGAELTGAPRSSAGDLGVMKTVMASVGTAAPPSASARPPGAGVRGAPGPMPAGPPPGVPAGSAAALGHGMDEHTDVSNGPPVMPRGPGGWGRPAEAPKVPDIAPRPAATPPARTGPTPGAAGGPRTCPECAASVPPAFRFCGVCGHKMPEDAPAQPVRPAPQVRPERAPALMTLIRPDGSEGGTHELVNGENKIGRNHGEIFENDGYLSPLHASLVIDAARRQARIRDLDSLNGVFVKMTDEEEEIPSGQILRIGQELLRFDVIDPPEPLEDGTEIMGSPNPGYWGKITVIIGRNIDGSAYPLLGESVTLGRERGEINFPDDGYVSGLHARISNQNGRTVLTDLGSSNGTFIKITGERDLGHHSFVLLGQQLFRLTLQ